MAELLYKDEVYAIFGAAMEVYNHLGPGFLEGVYQEALELEMASRGIPFEAQPKIEISYKGRMLKKCYIPDFIAFSCIVIKIKALVKLTTNEEAQIINQMKASGNEGGVLLNFGSANSLEYRRKVLTKENTGKNFPNSRKISVD